MAAGLMFAALYVEHAPLVSEALENLRCGAILLLLASIAMFFWQAKRDE